MESTFPTEDGLPETSDTDGSQWMQAIGLMRQICISALEVLRDFVFLAPSADEDAKKQLKNLCTTPSLKDLQDARLVIREVSEGVRVTDVVTALQARQAVIEMTPQSVRTNEPAHVALRFRDPKLDTAGARRRLRCEWIIKPRRGERQTAKPIAPRAVAIASATQGGRTRHVATL